MRAILIVIILVLMGTANAADLFVNGSMTDSDALNRKHSRNGLFIHGWYASTSPNPTYFNSYETNHVSPRNNEGFIGLQVFRSKSDANENFSKREFIQGVFKKPLEAGRVYYLSFDLSLHESSKWSVASLGLAFVSSENSSLNSNRTQHLKPDIHLANERAIQHHLWQRYNVRYRAKGGERSVIFGSFGNSRAESVEMHYDIKDGMEYSAFYFVDNFELLETMPEGGCFYQDQTTMSPPDRLTLLLDFSGSMRKSKFMDEVKQSVANSVKSARASDQITIIGFATETKVLYNGSQAMLSDSLESIIKECKLTGSTNVYGALKKAFQVSESESYWKNDQILLISDGEFQITSRFQKLLKDKSDRNISFLHLGTKKARSNYEDIGIDYLAVAEEDVAVKVSDFFTPSLNAESCGDLNRLSAPAQFAFIMDDSYSNPQKKDKYLEFLALMRTDLNSESSVQVYRSSTSEFSLLYDQQPIFLSDELVSSDLLPELLMSGGDEWCYATEDALKLRRREFENHHIVVLSAVKPNRPECANLMHSIMRDKTSELTVLHFNDSENEWVTYRYVHNKDEYLKMQSGQLDEIQIYGLNSADTGFARYYAKLESRRGKNNTISKHRRAHSLFNN